MLCITIQHLYCTEKLKASSHKYTYLYIPFLGPDTCIKYMLPLYMQPLHVHQRGKLAVCGKWSAVSHDQLVLPAPMLLCAVRHGNHHKIGCCRQRRSQRQGSKRAYHAAVANAVMLEQNVLPA